MRAITPLAFLSLLVTSAPPLLVAQDRGGSGTLRLGPGDQVRIEVAAELELLLELSGDYDIDIDGSVLVPLVGLVDVDGRPFSEVAGEIRVGFARELVDATVRVIPLLRIAVLGEVREPGLFPVDPTMTLAEVIAVAGGLTDSADRDDVRVLGRDGTLVLTARESEAALAVALSSGDRVIIGRRGWLSENGPLFIGAAASVVAAFLTTLILR